MGVFKDLHKNWAEAKRLAKFAFQEGTKKQGKVGSILDKEILPTYPISLEKKRLGPSLDDLDRAKTSTDRLKHKGVAQTGITNYRAEINKHKSDLDKIDSKVCALLLGTLKKIEDELQKVH